MGEKALRHPYNFRNLAILYQANISQKFYLSIETWPCSEKKRIFYKNEKSSFRPQIMEFSIPDISCVFCIKEQIKSLIFFLIQGNKIINVLFFKREYFSFKTSSTQDYKARDKYVGKVQFKGCH